jgi:hypothetical protein
MTMTTIYSMMLLSIFHACKIWELDNAGQGHIVADRPRFIGHEYSLHLVNSLATSAFLSGTRLAAKSGILVTASLINQAVGNVRDRKRWRAGD